MYLKESDIRKLIFGDTNLFLFLNFYEYYPFIDNKNVLISRERPKFVSCSIQNPSLAENSFSAKMILKTWPDLNLIETIFTPNI